MSFKWRLCFLRPTGALPAGVSGERQRGTLRERQGQGPRDSERHTLHSGMVPFYLHRTFKGNVTDQSRLWKFNARALSKILAKQIRHGIKRIYTP